MDPFEDESAAVSTGVSAEEEARKRAQAHEREAKFSCRFYENQYPEVEEVVIVNVKNIAEMGAYVSLLEYEGIEGMILLSELSRRRIRSIPKLIRVGKNEAVMVLRVDKEKGYIDLSKRRVSAEDIAAAELRYTKAKTVHSVLRHTAQTLDIPLKFLYETIGWPLYRKFGHAFDAFKMAVADADKVFEDIEMSDEVREQVLLNIRRRLTPQPHRIRADIEVTCFAYDGVLAIREALIAGSELHSEEQPLSIKLIAPPLFVLFTQSVDKEGGIAHLQRAIDVVKEKIEARGGALNIKMAPRATSQRDDTELSVLMEKLEAENREVDGDDDGDD